MRTRLERRWKSWEQPLLLISFWLHPEYRLNKFSKKYANLIFDLSEWLQYYFESWFSQPAQHLLNEIEDYESKQRPFDDISYQQFNGDILKYWQFCSRKDGSELAKIACRIYGICVNSASVERLFSNMKYLHSKSRNRLSVIIFFIFNF
jgi:hypothetical protein